MALKIQIQLDDEQELMFNQLVDKSKGNKTVVKGELIEYALNRFHKKLYKHSEILATLNTDENE